MRIALVSEGTYPFAMGGVSVWCDQLIRGLHEHDWDVVSLAVDGHERPVWQAPDNLGGIRTVPLWDAGPTAGRPRRPAAGTVPAAYRDFAEAVVRPAAAAGPEADRQRRAFAAALRALFEAGVERGGLDGVLTRRDALAVLGEAWSAHRRPDRLPLASALEASWLLERLLRPLWADAVAPGTDLVHASMNGLSALVGLAATWRSGLPFVVSEHGIYLRERYIEASRAGSSPIVKAILVGFFRGLAATAYLLADAIASHSAYNRRWALEHGADAGRVWTMYNGVSLEEFPVADGEPAEPTLVFMGRIDPLKDLHTLIRAFALVCEEVPGARLRLFGGTPAGNEAYRDSCVALVEELGLSDAAVFEGRVDSVTDAYHRSSVVVLTSISEGFPYTVVEAMACGRTVVCTNVGGVAEAVGDTGIVVPARDVRAIADACVRLLRYTLVRREMARAARERVVEHFTLPRSLRAYRAVYRQVVPVTVGAGVG